MTNERFTNPFPGLRPFESNEDHLFFGRDGQSDELLRRLRRSRFLAVLGTSGSGKSSLVRAGMLPSLYGGLMTQAGSGWRVALFRPGHDPIGNLAAALSGPGVFDADGDDAGLQKTITEATLRRSALGLVEATRQARIPPNENLLVVVDQFEEIFRFRRTSKREGPEDEAAAFIKLLLEAKRQTEVPIYIVITMRSDFLGDCSQFRDLPEAINDGQYLIPRMTRDQRREAITGPVAVGGGEISGRLVNRLLNEVGDNPDQLPILQHALMRTWNFWLQDRKNGEPIDLRHYDAAGTMSDALSRHADEAYDELPDEKRRSLAEKLFKSLTEKGPDNREIRRPSRVKEIAAIAEASPAAVIAVIEPFRRAGRSFLMPPESVPLDAESLIDISHESLIRGWERLRKWVDQEARSAQIYRRIAETAALHREDRAGLWHDPDLALALRWRAENRPNAVWAQHYHPDFDGAMAFIDASKEANEAEIAERERQRRRAVRRTRIFATVLGVAFLISLGFGIFAFDARNKAYAARNEALVQRNQAEVARKEAVEQRGKAVEERRKAEIANAEAQHSAEVAEKEEQRAEAAAKIADEQRVAAEAASERARQAQVVAERRRQEAERSAQESRRAAIFASKQGSEHNSVTTQLADRLIELTPPAEAANWRAYKATALTQLHRHDAARDESTKVLEEIGDNFGALTNRGYMNLIALRTDDALRDFERAKDLDPQSSLAYLNVSVAQGNLKKYDEAESSIRKAIEWYRPFYFDGLFDSLVSEDITAATHRSVIVAYGNEFDAALRYELANIAMFQGSPDFEQKVEAADRYADKSATLVEGYLTALNWAWYQERKAPGDYGALAAQGHLWQRSGYDDWARYYFMRFQCSHQEQKDARYGLVAKWVDRRLKSLPRNAAVDCLTPPSNIRDRRTRVYEADELGSAGRYKEALSLLDSGLREDPTNIELLLTRARYRKWSGDLEESDENKNKYYEGSRQDFAVALKLVDHDEQKASYKPIVYSWWADFGPLLVEMDDAQRKNYFEKTLELGPANAYAMSELSNLVAKTDPQRAIKLLERSVKFYPTADKYYRLAQLQNDSGNHQQAFQSIKLAISLQSNSIEFYKERERAETDPALGISEVERKRHLAAGYAEIGDAFLKQLKIAEAVRAYQSGLEILSAAEKLTRSEAVANDIIIIKAKISRSWEIGKTSRTPQYTLSRILSINGDAGLTREVIVDRGRDDGLEVGAEGIMLSAYSSSDQHERKVQIIGSAKVLRVDPRQATVSVIMTDAKGDGLVRLGDLASLSTRVPPLPYRSVLWRLAGFHITLTDQDKNRVFNDNRRLYLDETPELVDETLNLMASDVRKTAVALANLEIMSRKIESGRFKGKTLREVLDQTTAQDITGALEYVARYPATYDGGEWKITVIYTSWVLDGAPEVQR
jgi:hypothetical protein